MPPALEIRKIGQQSLDTNAYDERGSYGNYNNSVNSKDLYDLRTYIVL